MYVIHVKIRSISCQTTSESTQKHVIGCCSPLLRCCSGAAPRTPNSTWTKFRINFRIYRIFKMIYKFSPKIVSKLPNHKNCFENYPNQTAKKDSRVYRIMKICSNMRSPTPTKPSNHVQSCLEDYEKYVQTCDHRS